jgi:REP element-mobilizing transposase RayT
VFIQLSPKAAHIAFAPPCVKEKLAASPRRDGFETHPWTAGVLAGIFSRQRPPWLALSGLSPQCDEATLVQHVVFGLADAMPPGAKPPSAMHRDRVLDDGLGECLLRRPECAAIVQNALLHSDGKRYRLVAWCVMPNHVHVIAEQVAGWTLDDIVQAWKGASAHGINHLLSRRGRLWRREYFDRFMRDDAHLATSIEYVETNPVKAKLVERAAEWRSSSAHTRADANAGEDAGGPRT